MGRGGNVEGIAGGIHHQRTTLAMLCSKKGALSVLKPVHG